MNNLSSDPLKFPTIPLVVGVLSGLVTAKTARLLGPLDLFLGSIFGVALTLLVWVKYKNLSTWFAVSFIASSMVAYFASVWGPIFVTGPLDTILGPENIFSDDYGPGIFSLAGFLGALIVNLALLLLLAPPTRSLRTIGRAAAWACVGAFLGLLSSIFSEPVGRTAAVVLRLSPTTGIGPRDLPFYSAYLIWQTGMTVLIPLMLPHSSTEQAVSVPRSPRKLSIFGRTFFACVLGAFLVIGYFTARDEYRSWHSSNPPGNPASR